MWNWVYNDCKSKKTHDMLDEDDEEAQEPFVGRCQSSSSQHWIVWKAILLVWLVALASGNYFCKIWSFHLPRETFVGISNFRRSTWRLFEESLWLWFRESFSQEVPIIIKWLWKPTYDKYEWWQSPSALSVVVCQWPGKKCKADGWWGRPTDVIIDQMIFTGWSSAAVITDHTTTILYSLLWQISPKPSHTKPQLKYWHWDQHLANWGPIW